MRNGDFSPHDHDDHDHEDVDVYDEEHNNDDDDHHNDKNWEDHNDKDNKGKENHKMTTTTICIFRFFSFDAIINTLQGLVISFSQYLLKHFKSLHYSIQTFSKL